MEKNNFYIVRDELNETDLPYGYYKYCIDWNVPNITKNQKEKSGYIVQEVHFEPGLECIGDVNDYYEAWQVKNNMILGKTNAPDDVFSSENMGISEILRDLLAGSIGKKATTRYETSVYWVNKSDEEYNIVHSWKPGAIIMASDLKSVLVSDTSNFKLLHFICNRYFEHVIDCTNSENIKKSIINCCSYELRNKESEVKNILEELLNGTEFESLAKEIIAQFEIV